MTLSAGTHLGPYEVLGLVGAGGMGEVYVARDPRLGRDVAVKVLPEPMASDGERLRRFEREGRALGSLNHPNVLTVHDVGVHEGRAFLVTELLSGETLREVMSRRRVPVGQAVRCGVQIARGLEAAHERGIVHRDLKPENVFVTAEGRVKLLDFGLARRAEGLGSGSEGTTGSVGEESGQTGSGAVVGTVGYLSPEQARGLGLDGRTDIFALGVVLYELLSGRHPFRRETATATVAAIVSERPSDLVSSGLGVPPGLDAVVRRCLEKAKEDRFQTAHDVALALEAVVGGSAGAVALDELEERSPYPGLSSFTEKDAAVFFGREAEVEALWERIRRKRLLAVIGPSGAGKTSFLRAGVIASRPEGWGAVATTPGLNPGLGLAHALTPELAGDTEAMRDLLDGVTDLAHTGGTDKVASAVKRWRSRHAEVLLVVDQLEELFTLSPAATQERFAALLGRLADEVGVHVVLSLRDDFLLRCFEQEPLAPSVTPLTVMLPLKREALRRAVAEPALKRGYRFEDEALVEEMAEAVEGARGALPLLAFAVAQLWERRDRETKILSREAYEEIGGVAGALAQHAEATVDRIGPERHGLVREIFRNLATAQGTRAVVDREELLSAFPERAAAEEVLRQLVDARLLTTYEVEGKEGEPSHHRVEVVHESLLKAWPRLVRWQAQDEEGALLRDQLKQAAHLWDEKGRSRDLLWTGTAYQEFELWRGRYPGALTALEEDFARSMADKARRKRRLVRAAAATVVLVSTGVAIAIAVSRHQAVLARQRAEVEARRAEASKLLALAQLKLQEDPTEALALTTASLDLADTREARLMALRALQEAPPAWEVVSEINSPRFPAFSPDGRRLAVAGHSAEVGVWPDDGGPPLRLPGHDTSPRGGNAAMWASTGLLVTGTFPGVGQRVHVWSLPGGTRLRTIDFGAPSYWQVGPDRLLAEVPDRPGAEAHEFDLRSWRLPGGEPEALGRIDVSKLGIASSALEPHGRAWLYTKGTTTHLLPLPLDREGPRLFSRHPAAVTLYSAQLPGGLLGQHDSSGENRLLVFPDSGPPLTTVLPKPASAPAKIFFTSSDRWVRGVPRDDAKLRLWDTTALPGARPLDLRRAGSWYSAYSAFDPSGRIAVVTTHNMSRLTFWPVNPRRPNVVDGYSVNTRPVAFSPDSRWLATAWSDGRLRLWPLPGTGSTEVRLLGTPAVGLWSSLAFDPKGRYLFAVGLADNAWIVPLDGSPGRKLPEYSKDVFLHAAAVSPTGRRVATAFGYGEGPKTLRVFDVETGVIRLLDLPVPSPPPGSPPREPTGYEGRVASLAFVDDSTLYTAGHGGIRRWNLDTGAIEVVKDYGAAVQCSMSMSEDRRTVLTAKWPLTEDKCSPLERLDLATGVSTPLPQFGDCPDSPTQMAGSVLAVKDDDAVHVGRAADREAHLFLGHVGVGGWAAVSPDLKWVASTGEDNTLRLWPMPDLDQPPLQALRHDELLAKLRSLTNLRAVRDPKSSTGWTVELGPFPGWKNIPAW